MLSFYEEAKKMVAKHPEIFIVLEEYDQTRRLRKIRYKERVNFTIDSVTLNKFRRYCEKNNKVMSNLVESFMMGVS